MKHILFSRVVVEEDFIVFVLHGVIRIDNWNCDAGFFGHKIAYRLRRIGR